MDKLETVKEMQTYLLDIFPQIEGQYEIISIEEDEIAVKLKVGEQHLRPGGTVSGPAMFALADIAFYVAVLSRIGGQALAVTTNCSIDFMRKPSADDMIGKARILKLGKTLCVGDVLIYSQGVDQPVARASLTYAIPPKHVE